MAETQDSATTEDVHMPDVPPVATNGLLNWNTAVPAASSSGTIVNTISPSSPYSVNMSPNGDDDKPPPAKRARKYSDAEKVSITNVSFYVLWVILGVLIFIPSHRVLKTATPPSLSISSPSYRNS